MTFGQSARAAGRLLRSLSVLACAAVLAACAPQTLLLRGVADQLAGQGSAAEDDLVLAREASAFYLKLSESVLAQTPGHMGLSEAVAGGFTQYAYAFVAFEADRVEATSARTAYALRLRAARLYDRARSHGMAALEHQHPGFAQALAAAPPGAAAPRLAADEVGVAYWTAAAWGGLISLSKDKPDVVADLPQAMRLARLAWDRDPDHGQGALATLMASFEMARPDGSRAQAEAYFERAIAAGGGRSAGPFVARAETMALAAGDRPAFEALLRQALAVSASHPDLANAAMRERAQWLLDTADDRF